MDHVAGKGDPANFRVTLATLRSRSKDDSLNAADVRNPTEGQARQIFVNNYYQGPRLDRLPNVLQPLILDMSINHGPGTAIKLLQCELRSSGQDCTVDGAIGENTVQCTQVVLDASCPNTLINKPVLRRANFYENIVTRDPSQGGF